MKAINWKIILKSIGLLLSFETILLMVAMGVSAFYGEDTSPFLWALLLSIICCMLSFYFGKDAPRALSRRDGFIIVSFTWVIFSIIGMVPYITSGALPDVSSAFFETMSGFTTTGASSMPDVDVQPHGIVFWRSLTQLIGGVGIIFFTVAILPLMGEGEVKLFAVEATGPVHDKIHPRISVTARWIGIVYLSLTLLCILCIWLCGTSFFDAVNLAFATTATGGFSPHSELLHEYYHSPALEYTISFFMFASGINFSLLYFVFLKGKFRKMWQNVELRCYVFIVATVVIVTTLVLQMHPRFGYDMETNFRESLFTIVSMQTTTGFASCDYLQWPAMLMPFILVCMLCGACSGSTSGGFKCVRISMVYKVIKNELRHILHPHAVLPFKVNGNPVTSSVRQTLFAFLAIFAICTIAGTLALCLNGLEFDDALSISLSCVSNVGPAIGHYGPTQCWDVLSCFDKWVCSFLMLIGRLEIFPVLIIFTKGFWTKN